MTWRVLVSAPYIQPVLDDYRETFSESDIELFVPTVHERLNEEELLHWIGDMDGAICGDDQFTERVLRAAPRLRVISKWGTGIDSIDQKACERLGILICNTPNAFSEPVADSVLGYMLNFARKLFDMDQAMQEGVWKKIPGVSLRECTLGVIGVGNVGKAVVRRAIAFGMHTLGNDLVNLPIDFLKETGIEMVSKEQLLSESDFVSLNCDLNPTSYHLMGKREFESMKSSAFLINAARGQIVDEKALIAALEAKSIAGAALDVFEIEPLPDDSPLKSMENVLLAPHNANSSPGAWRKVHENTIRNLIEGLRREKCA
jgi:D-3-phosphoglycerate dehydrogenase